MDAPEDDQNAELDEIEPPLRLESPPPQPQDEKELWDALDVIMDVEEKPEPPPDEPEILPPGCPATPMHQKSYKYLRETREEASIDPERKYSTFVTRLRMETEMARVGDGMKPRFYQEDCAEAFLLGMNTGLICATGSGKTEAFVLPLFADPEMKSKIIIISPLNALQDDHVSENERIYSTITDLYTYFAQAKRFRKYGLSAAAVNGQTYSDTLHNVRI